MPIVKQEAKPTCAVSCVWQFDYQSGDAEAFVKAVAGVYDPGEGSPTGRDAAECQWKN